MSYLYNDKDLVNICKVQIILLYCAFFYLFDLLIELLVDFIYKSFFFVYMHYVQWILLE